jgi:hypothetical protein
MSQSRKPFIKVVIQDLIKSIVEFVNLLNFHPREGLSVLPFGPASHRTQLLHLPSLPSRNLLEEFKFCDHSKAIVFLYIRVVVPYGDLSTLTLHIDLR